MKLYEHVLDSLRNKILNVRKKSYFFQEHFFDPLNTTFPFHKEKKKKFKRNLCINFEHYNLVRNMNRTCDVQVRYKIIPSTVIIEIFHLESQSNFEDHEVNVEV